MQQAALALLRQDPPALLRAVLLWARRGRPPMKAEIAKHVALDPAHFVYRPDVLRYVKAEKAAGRRVVLATGSARRYADAVDAHFPGLFDAVYASDDHTNLTSTNKLAAIVADGASHGLTGFEYMGDSHADTKVFDAATVADWVGVKKLRYVAKDGTTLVRMATDPVDRPAAIVRLLRPHQWTKNLLVFLPLLTAHRWTDAAAWGRTLLAALALCVLASACYCVNDLLDVDADQRHPAKRRRPLAAGDVTLARAGVLALAGIAAGLGLAAGVNAATFGWLAVYLVLNLAYTLFLKRRLLVDVLALASLYALRPVIGGHATGVALSEWLVVFCAFFFASLSLLKRYTELRPHLAAPADAAHDGGVDQLPGRGYQPQDLPVVQNVGLICGMAGVLVLALYAHTPLVMQLYARPEWLWAWCPLVAYWLVRAWLLANRGTLHHDPVVFAFTDTRSYGVIAGMILAALLAGAKAAS